MYYIQLIIRLLIPFIVSYNFLGKIFYPLTIHFPYYLLRFLKYQVFIIPPYLITSENYIRFSEACAAISAYFLLLLLIVLAKDIKLKTRIKIFMLGSAIIYIVNMARILMLIAVLEKYGLSAFQQTHDILWIIFGSLLVALTWISLVRRYSIKSIPIYSDMKYLLKQIKLYK
ncbi:pacearchaeosortase [Candidatus Woesearchaeota archaeon]|nr:pacearchaeosortase [Candidatus Woesearchaeota archaeon]